MTQFNFDPNKPIIIDGIEYQPDEIYKRNLLVYGAQPTDFEDYRYVNIISLHTIKKLGSKGQAQALYRYDNLEDLDKFHAHQYPYFLPCHMITATDKKDNQIQIVLHVDFDNVKEMQLVERTHDKKPSAQVATKANP